MNHLSPPPSPHSQQGQMSGFANPVLDMNLNNSKNWIQRASAFNSVIATAAVQKLNTRDFPFLYNPLLYSSALLWPQFLLSSTSGLVTPMTPTTPKSPTNAVIQNNNNNNNNNNSLKQNINMNQREYTLTPEKETNSEDMPLNLSIKRTQTTISQQINNNTTTKTTNTLINQHMEDTDEESVSSLRRTQNSIIWSPASMCEKNSRQQQQQQQQHDADMDIDADVEADESDEACSKQDEQKFYMIDPIVRKFKYERRKNVENNQHLKNTNIDNTTNNSNNIVDVIKRSAVELLDLEAAQQQLCAQRNAFMVGLASSNNFDALLLSEHFKAKTQQQQQQQPTLENNNDEHILYKAHKQIVRRALNTVVQKQEDEQQQQQQQATILTAVTPNTQQQQQHQHQHPDSSTATILVHRNNTCNMENEGVKRVARNFQVSTINLYFAFK